MVEVILYFIKLDCTQPHELPILLQFKFHSHRAASVACVADVIQRSSGWQPATHFWITQPRHLSAASSRAGRRANQKSAIDERRNGVDEAAGVAQADSRVDGADIDVECASNARSVPYEGGNRGAVEL